MKENFFFRNHDFKMLNETRIFWYHNIVLIVIFTLSYVTLRLWYTTIDRDNIFQNRIIFNFSVWTRALRNVHTSDFSVFLDWPMDTSMQNTYSQKRSDCRE